MRNATFYLAVLLVLTAFPLQASSPCDSLQVTIQPQAGTFLFCPENAGQETFRAVAMFDIDTLVYDPAQFVFRWAYHGHLHEGSTFILTLGEPGTYPLTLFVEDPVYGCSASVTEVVKVGTIPGFAGTIPSLDVACARDIITLVGKANPTTWTGFPTSVLETLPIPQDGTAYSSTLTFDVFQDGVVVESEMDIDRICLNIDHVDFGPVGFEIECPNGTTVRLKSFGEGGANLGEPVEFDAITPGKGYNYCFSPLPLFGAMHETNPGYHAYTDMAGNYYFNAAFLPAGTYTPEDPLTRLIGCPLNGEWTIRVTDTPAGSGNGFIHSWSLFFEESFYPDSLIFTPEIVKEQWYFESTAIAGNPASQTMQNEGDYVFRFEATDNFGCAYDTSFVVTILPLPRAEILSDLEMPVCEGDSTILRVNPISGNTLDWILQWTLGGEEFPGRIFDTIMAKNPAAYGVIITDTVTGCQDVFSFDFSSQNCDLTIPNVFTPNADGINDVFEILNLEHYPVAEIVIFNRWGKKVFEHSDYYNNWWNGGALPDGVYFYVVKYARMGEIKHAQGAVSIIR